MAERAIVTNYGDRTDVRIGSKAVVVVIGADRPKAAAKRTNRNQQLTAADDPEQTFCSRDNERQLCAQIGPRLSEETATQVGKATPPADWRLAFIVNPSSAMDRGRPGCRR
jgi:hypothetical protein